MNGEGSYISKRREIDPDHRSGGSEENSKAILFRGHYDHNEFQQQQQQKKEDEQQYGDILV